MYSVGFRVGFRVGFLVGLRVVGLLVGLRVGIRVGLRVVGLLVGVRVGGGATGMIDFFWQQFVVAARFHKAHFAEVIWVATVVANSFISAHVNSS